MAFCENITENFITIVKRLPLKVKFLLIVSMIVVVVEIAAGLYELNRHFHHHHHHKHSVMKKVIGKVRERKEVNNATFGDVNVTRSETEEELKDRLIKFENSRSLSSNHVK